MSVCYITDTCTTCLIIEAKRVDNTDIYGPFSASDFCLDKISGEEIKAIEEKCGDFKLFNIRNKQDFKSKYPEKKHIIENEGKECLLYTPSKDEQKWSPSKGNYYFYLEKD